MADIAILVAEEYERRVKNSKKNDEEIDLVSSVSVMAKRLDVSSWVMNYNKKIIGEEKMELAKWFFEPKSQIGLAASSGFFSA